MYTGYGNGTSSNPSMGSVNMWYTPKSTREAEAFEAARQEIKNFLLVNKEGVNTSRIVNFLSDVGVVIPYGKFGLTFNEFLFHCQDIIQVRMFLPYVFVSKAKFIFLNPNAVDPESRHLLDMVHDQMTEKKKRPGQPRATTRNTKLVPASWLLDAPPPVFRIGPPTLQTGRGGFMNSPRPTNGIIRPQYRAAAPLRLANGTSSSNLVSRNPAVVPPRLTNGTSSSGSSMISQNPPATASPRPPARSILTSLPQSAYVGFGAVPRARIQYPSVFPPSQPVLPQPRMVLCGGGRDEVDEGRPSAAAVVATPPTPKPISSENPTPPTTPKDSQTKAKAQRVVEVPPGFVHPLQACPADSSWNSLKKRMEDESLGKKESLVSLTVTGFKHGEPDLFYVRLKEVGGAVSRIENMMKIFFEFKPENHTKLTTDDIMVNGVYGGFDKEAGTWRRVQVVKVEDDAEDAGDTPVTVFLIDHGRFLNLSCKDIRYLKEFHSNGLIRNAYYASCAYLPHEPRLNGSAAHFFMRMNTGQTFLCYLRNVEMRDHGPHLMLRFAQNLDKAD